MIRLGLLGATGKMGKWVTRLCQEDYSDRVELLVATGSGDDPALLLDMDVVIDFSVPEGMIRLSDLALKHSGKLPQFVVGSTGWTDDQKKKLIQLSQRSTVFLASNFSTGVSALVEILKTASPLLHKLGYRPVLVDTHHRHKRDSPSGTALTLQKVASPPGSNPPLEIVSIRAGEVVGDHCLTYYGPGDQIVIGHHSQDRSIFARGALDVAVWLCKYGPKTDSKGQLLNMSDYFRESLA